MKFKTTLEFKADREQGLALKGLAYWIADGRYIREQFGDNDPELINVDQTVRSLFDELDYLHVPFWVQNTVIFWAENWRRYKECDLIIALRKKGITI